MKKCNLLICFLSLQILFAQKKPKLVVGLVVDQMRYDYLTRFNHHFGNNGFNKLIQHGTLFENAHYNYAPTYTAVGHASIYTGTTPKNHGIIGNDWYDKKNNKHIYCVDDINFTIVGNPNSTTGKSPKNLVASTISDQLKISQNFKGKSIGIALKDRSAILPVGHAANAAYWFDGGDNGNWISSNYYMDQLPAWVDLYNTKNKKALNTYLLKPWITENNIKTYDNTLDDHNKYEGTFKDEESSAFPHNINTLKETNGQFDILKSTPYGNSITLDFAKAVIDNEKLGKDSDNSDFLAVSLSSTDYIGHQYGAMSKEVEDTYIRLNKDLDNFINYLDGKVGKNNYVLFLTADHAVADIPNYLNDHKINGGYFSKKDFLERLNQFCLMHYKTINLIKDYANEQIYLNHDEIDLLNLKIEEVEQTLVDYLVSYKQIHQVVGAHTLQKNEFNKAPLSLIQEGYNQKLSGDILLILEPNIISDQHLKFGTTHGSIYNYDTHVPVIFYGANIAENKKVKTKINITNIAPTVCNLLQITNPNMCTSEILTDVFIEEK